MKKLIISFFLLLAGSQLIAQETADSLSLEECYSILYSENPVVDKIRMSRKIADLNERIATSGWYPEIEANASASYQSDVLDFPLEAPGFKIPNFSKDHYNLALNITQPVFDGGRTSASKKLEDYSGDLTVASLESDLLSIKEQVDQVYFSILILQKQMEITGLVISDLEEQLETVQSQVKNGVILPGNEASLRAEVLNKEQDRTKIRYNLMAAYEVLSELLDRDIPSMMNLKLPEKEGWKREDFYQIRPELEAIDARQNIIDSQIDLANSNKLPTVSVFARPSYGRPGFNIFEDDLQFNWIVGLQARWSFKSTRNASIKTDLLSLEQKKLEEDRTLFNRKQNSALNRLKRDVQAIDEQIERDKEILELRKQVTEEKRKQVDQGASMVTEYINELNAESRAELQLELHKIQRVQTIINYETEQGWTWN